MFNLDEEGRAEKQLCGVAASNIIRNFSFMPDNEVIMAQHRHCLETLFLCLEDYVTGRTTSGHFIFFSVLIIWPIVILFLVWYFCFQEILKVL